MPALRGSINPDGPFASFANGLRALKKASRLTYRAMEHKTHYSRSVLFDADRGLRFPTLEVTLAYVQVCGGVATEWKERWETVRDRLEGGADGR